jgi:hypothetical protein
LHQAQPMRTKFKPRGMHVLMGIGNDKVRWREALGLYLPQELDSNGGEMVNGSTVTQEPINTLRNVCTQK